MSLLKQYLSLNKYSVNVGLHHHHNFHLKCLLEMPLILLFPSSPNSLTTELITFLPTLLRLSPYFYKWYQPPKLRSPLTLFPYFHSVAYVCSVCLFKVEFILFFSFHSCLIAFWLLSGLSIHQRLMQHLLWLVPKEGGKQDRLILSNNLPYRC